jgi:LCP family protein required for cell wall assembly
MTTHANIEPDSDYDLSGAATRFLTITLALAFLLSGALVGHLLREAVRNVVANAEVPSLPYVDITLPVSVGGQTSIGIVPQRGGEIPITGITGVPLPDYKKKERVNILLLGVDRRPDEPFARTDTIILVTVDPENNKAGMVSVPRDLYVDIPGYNTTRINQAYFYGEQDAYPGGGPALAMETMQHNFGVPVHFYVKVDFDGFFEIVDTLGGVDIDVPFTIDDKTFPDNNYGYDPFYIEAGPQHLDAKTTLKYVRSRHVDSDFGRAERQQQVLMALKDKALQVGVLPKIPELWTKMSGSVETNLQLIDIKELGSLSDEIRPEDVQTIVLGYGYTVDHVTEEGAAVLLPIYEKIHPVIDQMFAEVAPNEPSQAQLIAQQAAQATIQAERAAHEQQRAELQAQLAAEGAVIVIQNGTGIENLELDTSLFLREQGFNIAQYGPADMQQTYPRTVIVDYTGSSKEYTLGTLARFFNVTQENIRSSANRSSNVDIRVIIGADFELPEIAKSGPTSSILNK